MKKMLYALIFLLFMSACVRQNVTERMDGID